MNNTEIPVPAAPPAQKAFAALPAFVDAAGVVSSVSPGPGPLESETDYLVQAFPTGNDHGVFSLLFAAAESARLAKTSLPATFAPAAKTP